MNGFFQGRLINRKVGFLDTIEKNNLQTGIKSKKKKRQKVIFFNSSRGMASIWTYA